MVYFDKVKSGFSIYRFIIIKRPFCENVKNEMQIVINKELSGLEKGLNFLASVGSVGNYWSIWNMLLVMNSFTSYWDITKYKFRRCCARY